MSVIMHNIMAMNAQRRFNIVEKDKTKNAGKLSSGYKINKAADDAAGLSISEKMRNQIRNLNQAMDNVEEGIHFCKTGEGALNECHSMLNRLQELAVQAANDVNTEEDRQAIDDEVKQLQEEIRKTFRTTEFNGRKYFSEPYMPEMVGEPDNFELYNGPEDENGGYAGIMIDNVRYSWAELEQCAKKVTENGETEPLEPGDIFQDDGVSYKGIEIEVWSPVDSAGNAISGSEKFSISFPAGKALPDVERKLSWEAKADGIYMNNRIGSPSVKWADLNPSLAPVNGYIPAGEYSFEYHQTKIYFEVPKNATFEDVKNGLNNKEMLDKINWRSSMDSLENKKAIDVTDYTKKIMLTDDNKFLVDQRDNPTVKVKTDDGKVSAGNQLASDPSGIYIKYGSITRLREDDKSSVEGRDIEGNGNLQRWTQTSNAVSGQDAYRITDFNRGDDEHLYLGQTFDASAQYHYQDSYLGFGFDFQLTSASGYEAVKEGIQSEIVSSVTAPVAIGFTNTTIENTHVGNASVEMSYNLQRNTHKDFEDLSEAFSTQIKAPTILSNGDYQFEFVVKDSDNSATLSSAKCTVKKQDLYDACKNGGAITLDFQAGENSYGESFRVKFDVNFDSFNRTDEYGDLIDEATTAKNAKYQETYDAQVANARTYYSTHQETVRNNDGSYSAVSFENSAYRRNNESSWVSKATEESEKRYNEVYEQKYDTYLEKYVERSDKNFRKILNDNSSIKQTEQPYMTCYFDEKQEGNVATKMDFNVLMDPTDRGLYIQTGANAGEDMRLEWDSLNLNVIGLGNANVQTRETAYQFINHVQYASKVVSQKRSLIGAQQNRLEKCYDANANYSENLQNAESNIRDTDMAKEMAALSKNSILEQAAQAMIAQANQQNQGVLQLLQS